MTNQYTFLAYVLTLATIVGAVSIYYKSDVGIGFAGGLTSGAFGAMQAKKEE